MAQTYWNFMPEHAVKGTALVSATQSVPKFWGVDLIGSRIPVVWLPRLEIYLDNRDGSGWWKVTEGFGSPSLKHKQLDILPDSMIYDVK
jgi:hypothetical protein